MKESACTVTLLLLFPASSVLSPSFSHGLPLRGGRQGGEGGEVLLSDLSVSSAWPRLPQWRHYILLVLLHLATAPQQQSSTATACSVSPMELPLGGPALRHYTQSRPRPHRQKLNYRPSRPQVL